MVLVLLGMSGVLAACGGGGSSVSAKPAAKSASSPTTTTAPATVMTANSSLGTILVAANGIIRHNRDRHEKALWTDQSGGDPIEIYQAGDERGEDTPTMSRCTGACAMLWPPLTVAGQPVGGGGVTQSQLSVLNGPNGAQVVYAGHPLYEFSQDTAAGDVRGQNFANNIWHVLSATGQVVMTAAPTTTTAVPSSPSSGSGSSGGMGY